LAQEAQVWVLALLDPDHVDGFHVSQGGVAS